MAEIRLQKLLSERGVASRRKAEELIAAGKVKVNGHTARLGDKADDRRDLVTVCGKRIGAAQMPVYVLLNKPRGFITTLHDERGNAGAGCGRAGVSRRQTGQGLRGDAASDK